MTKYKRYTIINGKSKWVVTNENKEIINEEPCSTLLKNLQVERYQKRNVTNIYSDEQLINYLKEFYEENGRIPTQRDFVNRPGYPVFKTYCDRFGCWNNALKRSGLGTRKIDKGYKDEELLNYLKIFYEENGRIPVQIDFVNNPGYPCFSTYRNRFGYWNNALKLVGMDRDTISKQGNLNSEYRKGRSWEIMIIEMFKNKSFENKPIDLSGENWHSYCDGICPNGQTYDAKSSKLYKLISIVGGYWQFGTESQDKCDNKDAIQWYYFGAFNEDYTELLYVWRVPGEIVENDRFRVGMGIRESRFTVENMKEYDITYEFKKLLNGHNNLYK